MIRQAALALVVLFGFNSFCSLALAEPAAKPNFLFIFADDQCYDTVRAFGNEEIQTPNLDRIVGAGTTFTHAYNMGSWSGAVCVASRTMINTGRFVWKANKIYRSTEQERQAGRFWSEHLKKAGYRTYMTGKWHVRAKAEKAFDVTAHVRGGMPNQTSQGYNRPQDGKPDPWKPWDKSFEGFWKGGKHWSEIVADDALDFIADADKRDNPFFMYIAFNAPHDPRQSPKEYVDRYPLDKVKVPENFLPEYPHNVGMGCGRGLRDEKLAPFPRTHHAVKVNRQEYYAIITHMDTQIGRILDALDKSGKKDNTYIFYGADHGLGVGQHGLMGKQNMYDHSLRVPLMVIGPGVEKGKRLDTAVYLQDIMATTLDLAGIKKPDYVQFNSLMPILRGESEGFYDAIYGGYLAKQRAVIFKGHKLILYPTIGVQRLYNLQKDPHEAKDIIKEKGSGKLAKELFARLLKLQVETGDTLDLRKAYPKLAAGS